METRLKREMRDMEKRLTAEIAGSYDLHERRVSYPESRMDAIKGRLPRSH